MPNLKDQNTPPSEQMQLHFGCSSDLGNESTLESIPVVVAPSNVVQVDFMRENAYKSEEHSCVLRNSEKTYLDQVLDRARRLSW